MSGNGDMGLLGGEPTTEDKTRMTVTTEERSLVEQARMVAKAVERRDKLKGEYNEAVTAVALELERLEEMVQKAGRVNDNE